MPTLAVMKLPVRLDMFFTRGDDFAEPFQFNDVAGNPITTWTGMVFKAQIRLCEDDPDAIDFTVDATNAASGLWLAKMSKTLTVDLKREYVWDLERTDPAGKVRTLFAGRFSVKPDVTRAP